MRIVFRLLVAFGLVLCALGALTGCRVTVDGFGDAGDVVGRLPPEAVRERHPRTD